jgi:hypothetical protein
MLWIRHRRCAENKMCLNHEDPKARHMHVGAALNALVLHQTGTLLVLKSEECLTTFLSQLSCPFLQLGFVHGSTHFHRPGMNERCTVLIAQSQETSQRTGVHPPATGGAPRSTGSIGTTGDSLIAIWILRSMCALVYWSAALAAAAAFAVRVAPKPCFMCCTQPNMHTVLRLLNAIMPNKEQADACSTPSMLSLRGCESRAHPGAHRSCYHTVRVRSFDDLEALDCRRIVHNATMRARAGSGVRSVAACKVSSNALPRQL